MTDRESSPQPRARLRLGGPQLAIWGLAALAGGGIGYAMAHGEWAYLGGLGAAGLLLSAGLAVRLVQGLERDLLLIDRFALALAEGQLVRRLTGRQCAVLAPLAERLNGMARALAGIFLAFSRMSQEVSSVAAESRHNASGGDAGVRRQRDITCSSAATLEQLTVSLGLTSDSAQGAAEVADASRRMALAGAERVDALAVSLQGLAASVAQTADSAERLGERSREIEDIVGLIAEIAAQTNLLALNAAIEAARAERWC